MYGIPQPISNTALFTSLGDCCILFQQSSRDTDISLFRGSQYRASVSAKGLDNSRVFMSRSEILLLVDILSGFVVSVGFCTYYCDNSFVLNCLLISLRANFVRLIDTHISIHSPISFESAQRGKCSCVNIVCSSVRTKLLTFFVHTPSYIIVLSFICIMHLVQHLRCFLKSHDELVHFFPLLPAVRYTTQTH